MPLVSSFTRSEPVVVQNEHCKPDCETNDAVPEVQVCIANIPVPANSKPSASEDREMDVFLDDAHKKSVGDRIRQRNKKQEKNGQGLIQEISSSMLKEKIPGVSNHVTTISETARSRKSDTINSESSFQGASMIEVSQHLAQLCDKVLIAEECTLEANQEEIFCWY